MVAAGEIEGLPVVAAKGEVGRSRGSVDDATELLAVWIHDPKPARSTATDIALNIDLHAVGNTGLGAAQINKHMVGLFREGAVEANISLVLHLKEVGLPVVMISGSHDAMERAEENNLQLLRKRFHAQELYDAVNTALSSGEFGQRDA
jgi:hypothetical protein